jgi:uncharacterized protein YfdQ (DUF2303 family)
MDKSAINQIQESAGVNKVAEMLKAEGIGGLIVSTDTVGFKDLEKFMPTARHFRLSFATNQISEFEGYVEKNISDDTQIFIDESNLSAECIFDLGTPAKPLHKNHSAKLILKKTAVYRAILDIEERQCDQQTIAEFLEDWKSEIHSIDTNGGEVMTVGQAASSVRNLTIEQAREINSKVDNFGYEASAMERIEAKNKDALPSTINFKISTHQGLNKRDITLRLSILTGMDKPKIKLRIVGEETISEEIAEEFKDILNGSLAEKATIYIGTI